MKPPRKRESKGTIVLPYHKGISEYLRRIFHQHKVNICFKRHRTLGQTLVHPKYKSEKKDTCGHIYHIRCQRKVDQQDQQCKHDYIKETERNLKAQYLEHRRPS